MQNEKELIRLRRFMPAARTTRARSQERATRNFACGANYLAPGWFNFACGANYPHQALKGGYPQKHLGRGETGAPEGPSESRSHGFKKMAVNFRPK